MRIVDAPILADGYTIDADALLALAKAEKPKLITVGASLNLHEHPVAEIRAVADTVGAKVMFDAAHQCGIIAGKAWRDPLAEGAHFMTMSTYKSLGGPAGGVPVFEIAQRATSSHQFAVRAARYGGGQTASKKLRKAGFLACGIGLPIGPVEGDMNGLRIGTPELVRWGVDMKDVDRLANLITLALDSNDPATMARQVRDWRETFNTLHYMG